MNFLRQEQYLPSCRDIIVADRIDENVIERIYTDEGENSIDHIDENAHHAVSDIHLILCMACFLLCHCFASLPQHTAAISSDKALAANLLGDEVCCTQENDAYNTLQHADCC